MVSEYTEEVWSPRRESNPTFVPRRCVPLELDSSLPQRAGWSFFSFETICSAVMVFCVFAVRDLTAMATDLEDNRDA